ncbi:hypothetical protein [Paracoccus aminovorans]|uniref:hypothetical protein n=1 Tax=Paracoccus aminovorans TaxID=34004 RepID=UPI002B258029|nr:hypothetical protein [Paracoccus aminovorans]
MKTALACLFLAMTLVPAAAQVGLDEADSVMDGRQKELAAFQERLNDPDPDRALAVLKLLITKGDAEQRRMALRQGLQSTDSAVRATTLRAVLDSYPTLVMKIVPVEKEVNDYYTREILGNAGVLGADNSGQVLRKLTGYDDKEECWTIYAGANARCFARIRGEVVSLFFGDSWGNYTLNGEGALAGQQAVQTHLTNVTVDLNE